MKVSDRIAGLTGGGPDGWDLYRKARRMIAEGVSVTELTIGEHDVRTDPSILEAMRASAAGGHTGYAALPGTDALRTAVAARIEARTGVPTSRRNVVITPGGQAALFAAHVVACDPGDRALFIDPYYATYPGTIRAAGAIAVTVAAEAERDFRPDPAAIEAALPARSILVNSPNNPTGVVYDRATLDGIGEVARAHDLWIVSDEVYDTQVWSGAHLSPRALPGLAERTLVVGSLSKSHAMTGSRLGWLAGPEEAIAHAINLTTHTTYGVPGFVQDAGLFALARGEALETAIAAPFRRRHALAMRVLSSAGVRVVPSTASMYVMADIRPTGLSGEAFADRLLDTHAIAVMPGESFGRAAAGHLRIALTVADDRLDAALTTLANFHNTLKRQAA
ncbi:aminotransferase class I/II-fold pyridoxal phosphate-dependent enzyme [Silicimonas algicola]|uniref:Aminotransferase n=1 Tax=Silicimonas algicola TaxID=1826607 RepID=A0A316GA40_9RHOB|nr:aminotransferase class I/II-fold pyridoxal phosphate-dependent enzyme [Silicimonas algicola]AZQ67832.1 aminotransferase class I/II-fold pyridoxal phosphate-dependent enzyme [Silicimonas algicola]PWK57748.1 arginine:pyruvate transaminase [Silicimonas algicola]